MCCGRRLDAAILEQPYGLHCSVSRPEYEWVFLGRKWTRSSQYGFHIFKIGRFDGAGR